MEFRLLGSVTAYDGGIKLELGRRQERCLLGLLLLEPNRIVSIDRLLELLWDNSPRATAKSTLQTYVARLRSALSPLGVQISNQGGGYVIEVDPMAVDVHRFTAQVEQARTIADHRHRAVAFGEALALWRGPLMADAADAGLSARLSLGLVELRLSAIESRLEAELAAGDHEQVIAPLTEMLAQQPTRERVAELLMLALARSGRRGDALAVFRTLRQNMVAELGLEPATTLQVLHQRILNHEIPSGSASRQFLPRDIPDFTGRAAELALLDDWTDEGERCGAVQISTVAGIGGVGKTALAVHWAHRVAGRFPDGQLFLNLRGYDPRGPMPPVEALGLILRAFEVPAQRIPSDLDEASALYRAITADKKILIVLDNAGTASQVRPLLPSGRGSLVLITSRDLLGGLIAQEGARRLRLDTFNRVDAVELLRRTLGRARTEAEAGATDSLAELCGSLPLALRIAAANLANRPQQTIAGHVAQMRSDDRLGMLTVEGDQDNAVGAVFDLSYQHLDPEQQRVFRLLGLVPGSDFSTEAVAAMTGLALGEADAALNRLVNACLVTEQAYARYAMHDLLKAYAARTAMDQRHTDERAIAVEGLLSWFAEHTQAAEALLSAAKTGFDPDAAGFQDRDDALAWLDAERANVAAAVKDAQSLGRPEFAWRIAIGTRSYYFIRMAPAEMIAAGEACLAAATAAVDTVGTAIGELILSQGLNLAQRPKSAITHAERALALAESVGLVELAMDAINAMAVHAFNIGDARGYQAYGEQLSKLARQVGQPYAKHLAKQGLGSFLLGRLAEATAYLERALTEGGATQHGLAITLMNLGEVYALQGRYADAEDAFQRAVERFDGMGSPHYIAIVRSDLANMRCEQARLDEAWEQITLSRSVLEDSPDILAKAQMCRSLGMVLICAGRPGEAAEILSESLEFARDFENPYPAIQVLIALAVAHHRLGHLEEAMGYATEAGDIAGKFDFGLLKAKALNVIAGVHLDLGELALATEAASLALDLHETCGHPVGAREARSLLEQTASGA